jgi:hypothetical protein
VARRQRCGIPGVVTKRGRLGYGTVRPLAKARGDQPSGRGILITASRDRRDANGSSPSANSLYHPVYCRVTAPRSKIDVLTLRRQN